MSVTPATPDLEGAKSGAPRFQIDQVLMIISAHFIHDTYSAFLAPLLPSLINSLSLTLTQAGSLSALAQLPSLLNPVIGYLDDKVNLRLFVIFAPAITAITMTYLGVAPDYLSLAVLLFVTGLSIAIFHTPSPAIVARASGIQVGRGMSLYMAAGELGRTVGPLFASWGLLTFTLQGMFPLAIPGIIASIVLFIRFKVIPLHVVRQEGIWKVLPVARRLFIPVIGIIFFRSFLITGLGVYLPTLMAGEGATILAAGSTLALYQLAGVFGALLGGSISDRLGRKPVLFAVSVLAPVSVFFFLQTSGLWVLLSLIFAGFFSLSSQPVMLAIVQDHLPNHRSVANGFFMAISFICLSLSAVMIGMLGDRIGLRQALMWTVAADLVVAPLVLTLPGQPADTIHVTNSMSEN